MKLSNYFTDIFGVNHVIFQEIIMDGDNTKFAKDVILKAQLDNNPEELIEFLTELSNKPLFSDGIIDACISHGFKGAENTNEIKKAVKKYIVDKAKEKRIIEDANSIKAFDENLRLWLNTGVIWNDNETSRINVYKLCFALDMTLLEVEEFFLKKYLYRPFNLRDIHETVYFFAFNNSKDYVYAENLYEVISRSYVKSIKKNSNEMMTCDFRCDLENITDEDEFIDYCKLNSGFFNQYNNTAILNVNYYIDDIFEKLNKKRDDIDRIVEISELLKIIYGLKNQNEEWTHEERESVLSTNEFLKNLKEKLPKKLGVRIPSEVEIGKIRKYYNSNKQFDESKTKERPSSDSVRKSLVLMSFYNFFMDRLNDDPKENFEDYVFEIDSILDVCGYIQSYARNPFDWLFLYCARQEYPIDTFHEILVEFIDLPNE